jgi:cytidine deaminase
MQIGDKLFDAATDLIEQRYSTGWGGAAAVRIDNGQVLTSVAPDTQNDALSLCMEVGAYLQAHKLDETVTHSLCIFRENEHAEFVVLTPCGICQERLVYWGGDVQVAISNPENKLTFKTLRELQPHHWSQVKGTAL